MMKRFEPLVRLSLPPLLVLTVVGVILKSCNPPVSPNNLAQNTDIEPFLGHLQTLWDRYLDMIQLMVTLLTGVIAVSSGMVKLGPRKAVADRQDFASGIMGLLIGLACAVLWRVDAQLLMEIEMFGMPATVRDLYQLHGVAEPFTSSFYYAGHIQLFSDLACVFMVGTAVGLVVGLALIARFAYRNLPEATRPRSGSEAGM
jgi:hypothetical protein